MPWSKQRRIYYSLPQLLMNQLFQHIADFQVEDKGESLIMVPIFLIRKLYQENKRERYPNSR